MELEAGSHGTVYQVSYSEENVGKMVKHSKVRVTWNFVSNGGRDQHTVTLAWSKTTGKQEIRMDGEEVWFGRNKGRSVLDHNWTTRDESLRLHVLATCAPHTKNMNEDFRSFDLVINGQLFASLPHQDGLGAPLSQQLTAQNLPNSIIQILYPEGYVPPIDKNQKPPQRKEEGQIVLAQTVDSTIAPSSNNGVPHQPPIVDLLM
jgi:hypothetical protein